MIKNIINFNFHDIIKTIEFYKDEKYQSPVLLMNSQTLNILKKNYEDIMDIKNPYLCNNPSIPQLFGCYICVADWLSLGEVDIR